MCAVLCGAGEMRGNIDREAENCKPTCFSHQVTCFCGGSTEAAGLFLLIKGKDAWLTNKLWVSQPTTEWVFPAKTARAPGFPTSQGSRCFNTPSNLHGGKQGHLNKRVEGGRATGLMTEQKNNKWNLLFADLLLLLDFLMRSMYHFRPCRLEIWFDSSHLTCIVASVSNSIWISYVSSKNSITLEWAVPCISSYIMMLMLFVHISCCAGHINIYICRCLTKLVHYRIGNRKNCVYGNYHQKCFTLRTAECGRLYCLPRIPFFRLGGNP